AWGGLWGPVSGPQSPPQASDQLVVGEGDAEVVEELIDDLDHPDALDAFDDDGDDRGPAVLSALYVASDVLANAPANLAAAAELSAALDGGRNVAPPYGIEAPVWDELRRRAMDLEACLGEAAGEDEVVSAARALRAMVRPLV
ncbi:MAG TPA: hypothetical protein VNT56_11135, partial [Acidimicrobiales bacterium]|nr:hypothetical protein [Acidimicrobiales bacterium]